MGQTTGNVAVKILSEIFKRKVRKENRKVEKQKPLPLIYQDSKLDIGYRLIY